MCCNCAPRSATATKRCRWAFSISPAAWPVAPTWSCCQARQQACQGRRPKLASSRSPKPIANRSASSANSAARSKATPSARSSRSTSSPKVSAVDVTGTSKGRGTAGVMERHNFKGQRATHGVKKVHRHGGGTGQSNTFPARVIKGKRMAGRTATSGRTIAICKWCGSTPRTTCCWSAAPCPAPTAAT